MESDFEELIERLVGDAALTGTYGFSSSQVLQVVRTYCDDHNAQQSVPERDGLVSYESPTTTTLTVDDRLVDRVWELLGTHPDIVIRDAEHATEPETDDIDPQLTTDDAHDGMAHTGLKHADKRVFTTEQRMWKAITGHGVNAKRIPPRYFDCLSVIAAHGATGIAQPQVTKLTGQQKQSVPMRTDKLADRGYITKRTVLAGGTKTSLLKLKKFDDVTTGAEAGRQPDAIVKDPSGSVVIDYDIWFEQTIRLLKQQPDQLLALEDLRLGLNIYKKKYETRCLMRCVRRLANAGCFRKCCVKVAANDALPRSDATLRCLQLLREPTAADKRRWTQKDTVSRFKTSTVLSDEDDPQEDEEETEDEAVVKTPLEDEEDTEDDAAVDVDYDAMDLEDGIAAVDVDYDAMDLEDGIAAVDVDYDAMDVEDGIAAELSDSDGNGNDDIALQTSRLIYTPRVVRDNPNRSTPRILAKPRIPPEIDQKEFRAWAKTTAEMLVQVAERRRVQPQPSADYEARSECGEPATKRRRVSPEVPLDAAAVPPAISTTSTDVAKIEADILSKSWRGCYINPPGARDLKAQWYTSIGRPRNALIAVIKTERLKELAMFTETPGGDPELPTTHDGHDVELGIPSSPAPLRMRTACSLVDDHADDEQGRTQGETDVNVQCEPRVANRQPAIPTSPKDQATSTAGQPDASAEAGVSRVDAPRNEYSTLPPDAPESIPMTPTSAQRGGIKPETYTRHYVDAHPGEPFHHVGGGRWRRGVPTTKEQGRSLLIGKATTADPASEAEAQIPDIYTLPLPHQQPTQDTTYTINATGQDPVMIETFGKDYVDSHPDEMFSQDVNGLWRRGPGSGRRQSTTTSADMPAVDLARLSQANTTGTGLTDQSLVGAETFSRAYVDAHPAETFYHCGNGFWKQGQKPPSAVIAKPSGLDESKTTTTETFKRDYVQAHPNETFYHSGHGVWRRGKKPVKKHLIAPALEKDDPPPISATNSQMGPQRPETPPALRGVEAPTPSDPTAELPLETPSDAPLPSPVLPTGLVTDVLGQVDSTTYDAAYVRAHKGEKFHHVEGGYWRRGPKPDDSKTHNVGSLPEATDVPRQQASTSQLVPKKRGRPTKAMIAERERLQREAQEVERRSLIVRMKIPSLRSDLQGSSAVHSPSTPPQWAQTSEVFIIKERQTACSSAGQAAMNGECVSQNAQQDQQARETEKPENVATQQSPAAQSGLVMDPEWAPLTSTIPTEQSLPPKPPALAIVRPYYGNSVSNATAASGGRQESHGAAECIPKANARETTPAPDATPRTDLSDIEMVDVETIAQIETPTPAVLDRVGTPLFSPQGNKRKREPDTKFRCMTEGSNIPHQRTSIILDVLEQCGGVFPGNKEIMYPYSAAWSREYNQVPDRRTIHAAVKGLVDTGKLRKLAFSFRTDKGMNATSAILTLPHIDSTSELVNKVKEAMIAAYPLPCLPPEIEIPDEWRPKNGNFPVPHGRKTAGGTWVLPDGTISTTAPIHYIRDEFPLVEGLSVQRTKEAIDLRDEEARALGFQDARSRTTRKKYKTRAKRSHDGHHPGARLDEHGQELSNDDYDEDDALQHGKRQRKSLADDGLDQPSQTFKKRPGRKPAIKRLGQSFHSPSGTFGTNGVWPPFKDSKRALTVPKTSRKATCFHSPSGTFGTNGPWPSKVSKRALTVPMTSKAAPKRRTIIQDTQASLKEMFNMQPSLEDTPKKASRFGRTLTSTSRPLDHQFVGTEQPGFWETGTAMNDGNLLNMPGSPIVAYADTPGARDTDAPFVQKHQAGASKIEIFDKAYVLAHPNEVFHHVGRARYRRGPQPPRASKSQSLLNHSTQIIAPYATPEHYKHGAISASYQPAYTNSGFPQGVITPVPNTLTATPSSAVNSSIFVPGTAQFEIATKPKRKYKSRKRKADADDAGDATPRSVESSSEAISKLERLRDSDIDELVSALALVKTLCGGVAEQRVSWGLVSHTLSFRHEAEHLKAHWKGLTAKRNGDVSRIQAVMREPFLSAYERGELPRIDFQDLGHTDWPTLFGWWKTQAAALPFNDGTTKASTSLPGTTAAIHAQYAMVQPSGQLQLDKNAYFTAISDDKREYAAMRLVQGSRFAAEERQQHALEGDLTLLKSWCRAIAMTKSDKYSTEHAAAKIGIFSNTSIQKATDELLTCQILTVAKKDRQLPGRNYYLSRDTLKQFRRWPDKEGPFLQRVADAGKNLISHFECHDSLELGRQMPDPEILVLTNMVAQGQLKVKTILPERNDDFNVPFPKLSAWGVGDADKLYDSSGYDPLRFEFPVIYHKTAGFTAENGLTSVAIPLSAPAVEGERGLRLPFWVDIHGNLVDDLWDMTLRSLLHLLVYRTGITAAGMEKAHDGKLWAWEIRIALGWMEEVGLAVRFGPGKETEGLWNGGWRAGEWWYCAFAPEITTWQIPGGGME